jgi:XTP/dITP diphosphohydrolase
MLLATGNPGKIREFRQLLGDLPLTLVTPADLREQGIELPDVIEDGDTFEHNARKKALELARATGILAMSDDSGLQVDVLGGAPGVRSARYAGEHCDDDDNNQRLVRELADVPFERRTARYRVVLAVADPEGPLGDDAHLEAATCEGHIQLEPRGQGGFGYDPHFQPVGHDRRMAELTPDEKNAISHRGKATRKMREFLERYLAER